MKRLTLLFATAAVLGCLHPVDVAAHPTRERGGDATFPVGTTAFSGTNGGTIGLYTNPQGTNCDFSDTAPGLIQMYVVHTNTEGSSGVEFAAPIPECITNAIWMGDAKPFATSMGTSQSGVDVLYGACLAAPVHVMTINIFGSGTTGSCCAMTVVPHPANANGWVAATDCTPMELRGFGLTAYVNGNEACPCQTGTPLPTERSTWGRVKSLYSN